MIASVLLSISVLICLGAFLHFACGLARAALVWAPSGYAGIVVGWYVTECLESTAFGIAAALRASALVRFAIVTAWRRVFASRRLALIVWTDFR